MARSILEAANVILPTGNPCEGCFDELGHQYEIPIYCIVPPTNLSSISDDEDDENDYIFTSSSLDKHITAAIEKSITTNPISIYSSTASSEQLVPAPDCSKSPFPIIVRLSTDQDIHLTISSEKETIGSLRSRIFDHSLSNISTETHILRLIYLGRIFKDTMSIICEAQEEEVDVEQTFFRKDAMAVAKNSIIQALMVTKKQNECI